MPTIRSHIGLRGLAATTVVIGHYCEIFAPARFPPHTHVAVDFFFLLSGFILAHIYGPLFSNAVSGRNFRAFLTRRLARIYPLHLLTLLLILAIRRFRLTPEESAALFPNLGLFQAWGISDRYVLNAPSWSISCEFAAYLAFPVLALVLARRGGWVVLACLGLAGLGALWMLGQGSLDLHVMGSRHVWLRTLVAFLVGMLLAQLVTRSPPGDRAGALQLAAVAAFAGLLAVGAPEASYLGPMALLVYATAEDRGVVARFMSNPLMTWLGDISYGMYMIQWVVILALYNIRPKLDFLSEPALQATTLMLFFGSVLIGAAASARWFEPIFTRAAQRYRLVDA